jgi:hypothetical protein
MRLSPDDSAHLERTVAEFLSKDLSEMEASSVEWWRLRQELASGTLSEVRAAEVRRQLHDQFGPGADTWPICKRLELRDGTPAFVLGLDRDAGVKPRVPPAEGAT